MSGDDEIIIRGGRGTGDYWGEYDGRRIQITGWRLMLVRLVANWIYSTLGE